MPPTYSIWQRTVVAASDLEVDVAVVGGGLSGASTAYWLRKLNPALRIVLVEAGHLGAGASGRNAGFLLQGATGNYQQDLAHYGEDVVQRVWAWTRANRDGLLSALDPAAFSYEATGSLTVAGDETEDEQLRASAAPLQALGYAAEYWPAETVAERLQSRGFGGGLYLASNGAFHPARLVYHIADRAEVQVLTHHPVEAVEAIPDGIRLHTPLQSISARQAVFALNAYLPRLFPDLAPLIRPVRAQMLATEPMETRWLPMPVYTHGGYYYLRQDAAGRVLLGGARHLHEEAERGFADETTEVLQTDLRAYLNRHFPAAEDVPTAMQWSGVMGFSKDHLPLVGPCAGYPGSWWVGGYTGHGMAFGFRMGRLLAECVLGVPEPEGLDLFDARRLDR